MTQTLTNQLYEVNLYVELDYPDIVDTNGNEGVGRFENDLPDWNIIYLTDLEEGDFWQDFANRFPEEAKSFNKEYGKHIVGVHLESHDKAEEGTYEPPVDDCYIHENGCPWEAYEDEWDYEYE